MSFSISGSGVSVIETKHLKGIVDYGLWTIDKIETEDVKGIETIVIDLQRRGYM